MDTLFFLCLQVESVYYTAYMHNVCVVVVKTNCTSTFRFKQGNAFVGYQKDTPAVVVLQATNQLQNMMKREHFKLDGLKEASVLGNIHLEELMEEEVNSDIWKQAVSFDRWIISNWGEPEQAPRSLYNKEISVCLSVCTVRSTVKNLLGSAGKILEGSGHTHAL